MDGSRPIKRLSQQRQQLRRDALSRATRKLEGACEKQAGDSVLQVRGSSLLTVSPQSPIVVVDSGLGGLTVVAALRQQLPHDEIVYFGDTARLPYGSKTAATVTGY